jgi:predicted O-methyltransferase YrrM
MEEERSGSPARLRRVTGAYRSVLTPGGIARRVRIGVDIFRDHQFERYSPLPAVTQDLRDAIGSREVVLPPMKHLGGEGSQTVDGIIFLASLASALSATTVFEIGTFKGVTTWTLARNLADDATVHTLDLPYEASASLELSELDEANRKQAPTRLFETLPTGARVEQHWGDSATFDFSPFRKSCDLVYVDGAHTREYVDSDTRNALDMVSENGAIVWDDYWRQEPGVRDVLDALALRPLYRLPRTRLVFHLTSGAEQTLISSLR